MKTNMESTYFNIEKKYIAAIFNLCKHKHKHKAIFQIK